MRSRRVIKFLFDGEEEVGSPSLPGFVKEHAELLRADAALSFDGGFEASDCPLIEFGSSGLLCVELRLRGASRDLHSARARLVENSAWRGHAADEFMTLRHYHQGIKYAATIYHRFGAA